MHALPAPRARAGFTLLELVVVVAILAVLSGAAVPVASKYFNSRARAATRTEMDELAEASLEYFRDVGRLPTGVANLISDPGRTGWTGPYLAVSSTDAWSGATDLSVDAWARAYAFTATGASVLELRSRGEDGVLGDATDLVVRVDVTPVRREKTLYQLEQVNRAIGSYNARYLPGSPLPTRYSNLLSRLVSRGLLPATTPFAADGWGAAFVPDPAGRSPVVAVTSVNLR